jgi:hypothetical protein
MLMADAEEIAVPIPCGTDIRLVVYGPAADTKETDQLDSPYNHMFMSPPYGDFCPQDFQFYPYNKSHR